MGVILKRNISRLIFVTIFVAICLSTFNSLNSCFAQEKLTIQERASKIFGEAVGDDNNGEVYSWGLTAKYKGPKELVPGEGKFKNLIKFLPAIRWYDPAHYYESFKGVEGEFTGGDCVLCHQIQTPGVVKDWRSSKHSRLNKTEDMETAQIVTCDKCHGNNHMKLRMPDYNVCAECHKSEVEQHKSGGAGAHVHSFHLQVAEQAMQINTPAEELHGCATCHGIAENRCDGCHTRHKFSAAEARKPETCGICHLGLEHYDYEVYLDSYHGRIYKSEGYEWDWNVKLEDWTKPQVEGQKRAPRTPTCAYCHMPKGTHDILEASTEFTYMGSSLVDRGAEKHKEKREAWIKVCKDCHSSRFARDQLEVMDEQVKLNFAKVREAFEIILDLYEDGILDPMPEGLAPDWQGHQTFSLLPEGETRVYNVSDVERMYFEMATYEITNLYKAAAHNSAENTSYSLGGAIPMHRKLIQIKAEASKLRRIAEIEKKLGIKHIPYDFWSTGEYTDLLNGKNRKEGDVLSKDECLHNDEVDCLAD